MHTVQTTVVMPAPVKAPSICNRHQFAHAPLLTDQGWSPSEAVVFLVDIKCAAECVIAQHGATAADEPWHERPVVNENAVKKFCLLPLRPHALQLNRCSTVKLYRLWSPAS